MYVDVCIAMPTVPGGLDTTLMLPWRTPARATPAGV